MMSDKAPSITEIPSMGGRKIGPTLRELVRNAPADTAIVEVGSWLGAGTAELAMAVRDRGPEARLSLHCFDQWRANESEAAKALMKGGVHIEPGQDTLPIVQENLRPIGVPIQFHKGDIRSATWDGSPISVYVDDAAKRPAVFASVLKTFGPSWIPGVTAIALMDFLMWRKSDDDDEELRCQQRWIDAHPNDFEEIARPGGSCVVFRYVKQLDDWSV